MGPPLSRRSVLRAGLVTGLGVAASGSLAACAGTVTRPGDLSRLRVMAPASPGGGWDTTSRVLQQVIQRNAIARNVQVFNVEGAGGTIGLGQLARETDDALLMTMGLVMVGAILTNDSDYTLDDVTPVARLTGEAEIVVVPGDSPYDTMEDLVAGWAADPRGTPIAGGSAGGTDQILAGLIALEGGIDPTQVNYIAYSGGGESLAALLGGQVAAGISGVGEYAEQVRAGDLKGLAVSSPEPVGRVPDVPTLLDAGLDIELSNWRGVMARPGMSEEALTALTDLVVAAHDTDDWRDELETNGWDDLFATGDEYATFVREEQDRVREVLVQIGLVQG